MQSVPPEKKKKERYLGFVQEGSCVEGSQQARMFLRYKIALHTSSAGSFARLDCSTALLSSLAEYSFKQPPKYWGDKLHYTEIQRAGVFSGIHCTSLQGLDSVSIASGCTCTFFFLPISSVEKQGFPSCFFKNSFFC